VNVGNVLYQQFYLASTTTSMTARWVLEGDHISLEIASFPTRPARQSMGPGNTQVTSFGLRSLQRCRLDRD
jgi:hypothetical protein